MALTVTSRRPRRSGVPRAHELIELTEEQFGHGRRRNDATEKNRPKCPHGLSIAEAGCAVYRARRIKRGLNQMGRIPEGSGGEEGRGKEGEEGVESHKGNSNKTEIKWKLNPKKRGKTPTGYHSGTAWGGGVDRKKRRGGAEWRGEGGGRRRTNETKRSGKPKPKPKPKVKGLKDSKTYENRHRDRRQTTLGRRRPLLLSRRGRPGRRPTTTAVAAVVAVVVRRTPRPVRRPRTQTKRTAGEGASRTSRCSTTWS